MEQGMAGLRALSQAILDDTKDEATQLVADAQREAKAKIEQARAQAAEMRQQTLARAQSEIAALRQASLATARLEAQRLLLRRREELIDQVLERAREELRRVRQLPQYDAILRDLIVDAVEQLNQPEEVFLRVAPEDALRISDQLLRELAARWNGRVRLSMGEPIDIEGGVVMETEGGRQRYDNSLLARLARERMRLRAQVYRILQGEQ